MPEVPLVTALLDGEGEDCGRLFAERSVDVRLVDPGVKVPLAEKVDGAVGVALAMEEVEGGRVSSQPVFDINGLQVVCRRHNA